MSIFEVATRKKLRFPSERGDLTVEQLWDLELTSRRPNTKFDLDTVARTINGELKSLTEDSFVSTSPDPRKATLELQLEIVKHVIATKIAEQKAANDAADKAAKRKRLIEALSTKEEEELRGMSREQILAKLEEIG